MRYKVTITELGVEGASMTYSRNVDALGAVHTLASILSQNESGAGPAERALNIDATAYKIEIEVIR